MLTEMFFMMSLTKSQFWLEKVFYLGLYNEVLDK